MSLYRSSSRAKTTYYSYASRIVTHRLARAIGVVAWCVPFLAWTLSRFDGRSPEWLVWVVLPNYAVLLVVAAWRWHLRRRTLAQAGFRESSPD